jgi:hypothetical protein
MAPPCDTTVTGTLTDESFPAFGDMTGAVAYFAGGWVAVPATVSGGTLSAANHTLDISFPESDAKVFPGGGNDHLFRLIGKRAFLTAADEWFYDAASTTLYLWPPTTDHRRAGERLRQEAKLRIRPAGKGLHHSERYQPVCRRHHHRYRQRSHYSG